jgi:hypothetical protein
MEKITAYQGNDIVLTRQIQVDGTIIDITDYVMRLGISESLDDLSGDRTPNYITDDFPIDSTFTNSTTRTLTVPSYITSDIPSGGYYYEIQLTDPTNKVFTVEIGKLILQRRIIE